MGAFWIGTKYPIICINNPLAPLSESKRKASFQYVNITNTTTNYLSWV